MHRSWMASAAALAWLALVGAMPAQEPADTGHPRAPRPNIVLMMADDGGYSDLGCYGGEIRTPNLDRLARAGLRFRRCYNFARCSPTRAALLTGRYPTEVGMGDLATPDNLTAFPGYRDRVDADMPMLAELLRDGGYHTLMAGKWHLGGDLEGEARAALPGARGFDRWFGVVGAQAPQFITDPTDHKYAEDDRPAVIDPKGWYATMGCMDWLVARIQEHVARADGRPFFAYVPFQSPHTPLAAPRSLLEVYEDVYQGSLQAIARGRVERLRAEGLFPEDAPPRVVPRADRGRLAVHAAMTDAIDRAVGRLVRALEGHGLLEDTLLLYLSDNGGDLEVGRVTNAPYFGAKCVIYEGGCLSPLIVHWPAGGVPAGQTSAVMTTVMDMVPTLLQAAGVPYPARFHDRDLPPLEGRSLLGAFRGEELAPPPWLFFDLYGQKACIRDGRWKLVRNGGHSDYQGAGGAELFDLAADPAETRDVSPEHREEIAAMIAAQDAWERRARVEDWRRVQAAERQHQQELLRESQEERAERKQERKRDKAKGDGGDGG